MKGWLLYYSEKRKNAEIRRTVQQTPHFTKESLLNKWSVQSGDVKKHNSQGNPHFISKPNGSRTADNNSRAKWKGIKKGR